MADPTSAQSLILSSDFTIDKVIYKNFFSQSVPTAATLSDSQLYTIPHGLPFTPLCIGTYSDDNFATHYEFGNGPFWYDATFMAWGPRIFAIVESDATNIYVTAINFDTTRTFYFKVIGFPPITIPAGTNIDALPAEDTLLFNSDANYLKVYSQGTITHIDSGAFGYDTLTASHNLGYIPTGFVWSEFNGKTRQISAENSIGIGGADNRAYFDENNLTILTDPFIPMTIKFHYKIYLDG